jgi:VCBS repeat-containing protein
MNLVLKRCGVRGVVLLLMLLTLCPPYQTQAQPLLEATLDDTLAQDGDNDGEADRGDTIRYRVMVRSAGDADAGSTAIEVPLGFDFNLVPDSVKIGPIALDDSVPVNVGGAVEVPVLANDRDVDGSLLPGSVVVVQQPAAGSVAVDSDTGAITYTSTNGAGVDTFRYTVQDDEGLTSREATVTITVNTCPLAVDDAVDTPEDDLLNGNVIADNGGGADSDGDAGATLTVTELNGSAVDIGASITLNSGALLTLSANGDFTYDPNGVFNALDGAGSDTDSFSYTLSDGACTDNATVTITLQGENDCPAAADDSFTVAQNGTLSDSVTGSGGGGEDSDPDTGDTFTVVEVNGQSADVGQAISLPSGALLTLNSDGTFNYDPNGAYDDAADAATGSDSFAYTISDGDCSDSATVSITITGENDCPVAQDDSDTTDQDTVLNGDVLADNGGGADEDADTGATLTITEVNGVAGNVGTQITLTSGALLTISAAGTYSYDPNGVFDALPLSSDDQETFTYTVSDGTCTDTATVTVTITGLNECPVAADDADTTDEASPLSGNVLSDNGSGADSDIDTGTTLVITAVNGVGSSVGNQITLPSGALLTLNANGAFSYDPNGQFEGLSNGETDADSFAYTVGDGTCTDTATMSITIDGVSDGPLAQNQSSSGFGNMELIGNSGGLAATATASPSRTSATNLLTGATDVDSDSGDIAVVAASGSTTEGGTYQVFADGSFRYVPPAGLEGDTDTFDFTLTDGVVTGPAATVTVTVGEAVWFINNTGGGSGGSGTTTNPFLTMLDFNAANGAGSGKPATGDQVYLVNGGSAYTSGITLLDDQRLTGSGAALVIDSVTVLSAGTAPTITSLINHGVSLGSGNTLAGLNVGDTPGFFKIRGTVAGNFAASEVALTGSGGAIQITTSGAFGSNVTFSTLESSSSPGAAIDLTGVTGTLGITSPGSGISGSAASSAAVTVSGGSVSFTYTGAIAKANAGALVSVSGGHDNGTLTFNTGALNASSGTGLQFDNADGTYTFSGTVTLNGGDAGIDIVNGSDGDFTFSNAPITSPSGAAFVVNGGNGVISHGGTIAKNTTGRLFDIQSRTGGSVALSGSFVCTTLSTGILLENNSGGTLTFSGTIKSLSTAAAALTVTNGTGSTTSFTNGGLDITTTAGAGILGTSPGTLVVSGSPNSVVATGGPALDVDNGTLQGEFSTLFSETSSTQGLDLSNLSGTSTLTITSSITATSPSGIGLRIDDVESGAILSLGDYMVTNRGSHGIFIQDFDGTSLTFGDVNIANALSVGGNGVHVQTSGGGATSVGAITFASLDISATNATVNRADAGGDSAPDNTTDDGHGVRLIDHTGTFTVTGEGTQGDGGTIQNIEGDGFSLIRSGGLDLDEMTINNIGSSNQAVATVDNAGIYAYNLVGTNHISNSTISRFQDGSVGGGLSRGISLTNDGQSFTEMRVTDVTFFNDNSLLGDDAIQAVTYGTVNGALIVESAFALGNVSNNSEFYQISGHAVQVVQNGGGTLTTTVHDSTFRNTITPGGFGGIDIASAGSGIMSTSIDECLLYDLYPGGVNNSGVITLYGAGTVDFDATVNNCIFGTTGERTSDGRGAIRASTDTDTVSALVTDFDITITNNTIDDTDREAISILPRGGAVPIASGRAMEIIITGNDIGQTTAVANDAGLGREGIEIVATENAKLLDLTIENNAITNFVDSSSDESIDIDINDNTSANITVRGNTFSQSGASTDSVDISSNTTGTLNLDMNSANSSGNTCPNGITITETAGTYSIEDIGGAAIPAATVKTFIQTRNTGSATVTGTFDSCNFH